MEKFSQRLKGNSQGVAFSVCIFFILAISGCTSCESVPSGFLSDYSSIWGGRDEKKQFFYRPPSRYVEYSKVMIDPVTVCFHPDAHGVKIDEEKLKDLSDFFYNEIKSVFQDGYLIVDEHGKDVLCIRAAITDVVPNKPIFNIHWSTVLAGFGLGGASMEAEFIDSMSGKRVFAVIESQKGKRRKYLKGLKKWGHTEDILSQWALMLREEFDKIVQNRLLPIE